MKKEVLDLLKKGFFELQKKYFVLWFPKIDLPPFLIILPKHSTKLIEIPFEKITSSLWVIPTHILKENTTYYYWFKVQDGRQQAKKKEYIYVTDPFAKGVERKIEITDVFKNCQQEFYAYASVIRFQDDELKMVDEQDNLIQINQQRNLPNKCSLVIYELPTRWTKTAYYGKKQVGQGTFQEVCDLLNTNLEKLGVNALELLPVADSDQVLNWGYGTAHFFTPDYDLGGLKAYQQLVNLCQTKRMHFFYDAVMAFAVNNPYQFINYSYFFLPEEKAKGRYGFGGELFFYDNKVKGVNLLLPKIKGDDLVEQKVSPAQIYMQLHLLYWQKFMGITGYRIDSINNIDHEPFLQKANKLLKQQQATFVLGEELSMPKRLVDKKSVDSLWNEAFKHILREVLLGKKSPYKETFEETVFELIDCRKLGYAKATQVINYITSHDVEGYNNERLYNFLNHHYIEDKEKRMKLAFVCLLTAVGIPMIFAGEEFADIHHLDRMNYKLKQQDPIHYHYLSDPWRKNLFEYVSRLVHFRKNTKALQTDEVKFIHVDCQEDRKVVVWQRNYQKEKVIVVANFSDYVTPLAFEPQSEYYIPKFPKLKKGQVCFEITQNREVTEKIGRESIFPWEAKVYYIK